MKKILCIFLTALLSMTLIIPTVLADDDFDEFKVKKSELIEIKTDKAMTQDEVDHIIQRILKNLDEKEIDEAQRIKTIITLKRVEHLLSIMTSNENSPYTSTH